MVPGVGAVPVVVVAFVDVDGVGGGGVGAVVCGGGGVTPFVSVVVVLGAVDMTVASVVSCPDT